MIKADVRRALLPVAGVVGACLLTGQSLQAERSAVRVEQAENVEERLQADQQALRIGQTEGHYQITPERRALLNTIRYAEGTWKDGHDLGYQILYGGGQFADLSRHTDRVVVRR